MPADLSVAACLSQDWNDGRIPYFTLPPKRNSEVAGSSQLVGTWGAAFDADQSATLAGLRSMDAGEGADAFFQTDTLGAAHVDLEGMQQVDEAGSSSSDEEQEGEAGELRGPGSEGTWHAVKVLHICPPASACQGRLSLLVLSRPGVVPKPKCVLLCFSPRAVPPCCLPQQRV